MISVLDVNKSYGDTRILKDVTTSIPKGGVTSIIGPNGAGKSTFLAIMSRLLSQDGGSVSVDGLDISKTPTREMARKLAILRQDNHMSARLTVRDLVSFGRYPHSQGRLTAEDKEQVARALDYMGLTELGGRYLDQLSGGQRQRAFAAMILCQDTDYVLLDEPLNNLDLVHAQAMMTLLQRMCRELGKTVVVVLHDLNFASWYSEDIIAMKNGEICHSGKTAEIMRPEILREIYGLDITVLEVAGHPTAIYYGPVPAAS